MDSPELCMVWSLNEPMDWLNWNSELEALAKRREVWDYIDPTNSEVLIVPDYPPMPENLQRKLRSFYGDDAAFKGDACQPTLAAAATTEDNMRIAASSVLISSRAGEEQRVSSEDLTMDILLLSGIRSTSAARLEQALGMYQIQVQLYEIEEARFTNKKRYFDAVVDAMQRSLSTPYRQLIIGCVDARSKYKKLQEKVKPTQAAIDLHLSKSLEGLLKKNAAKNTTVGDWCEKVEITLLKIQHFGVACSPDGNLISDKILQAICPRFEIFAAITRNHMHREKNIGPREVLRDLRKMYPKEMKTNSRGYGKCDFCHRTHVPPEQQTDHWKSCWLCIPESGPPKLVESNRGIFKDKEAKARVREFLEENPKIKKAIAKERRRLRTKLAEKTMVEDDKNDKEAAAETQPSKDHKKFTTMHTTAEAIEEQIELQSTAEDHVFRDLSWFDSFVRVEDEVVKVGGVSIPVEGRGLVRLRLPGNLDLSLPDVVYAPSIGCNCLSLGRLKKNNIFWDEETGQARHQVGSATKILWSASPQDRLSAVPYLGRGGAKPIRGAVPFITGAFLLS